MVVLNLTLPRLTSRTLGPTGRPQGPTLSLLAHASPGLSMDRTDVLSSDRPPVRCQRKTRDVRPTLPTSAPTPSSTATRTSRSWMEPRPRMSWSSARSSSACRRLAITDHQGLYGVVRFSTAAREAGLHPVIGLELELLDAFASGSGADRRARSAGRIRRGAVGGRPGAPSHAGPSDRLPVDGPRRLGRVRNGPGCPGHRAPVREDLRGVGAGSARSASRPARPRSDGLSQPVPARQPGQSRRDEGCATVQPGAPRRAHRRTRGAVGLPRR